MSTYAVRYTYDHRTEHRLAVRPSHRAWLASLLDAGALLASGPLVGEPAGALLVFRVASRAELDAVLARDPFAGEGLIADVDVREWEQVLGPWA